jgi:PqqD family protein of HPr-rel-A system
MTKPTTYTRQPGYAAANLNDELAVLDLASGKYLGFNATAAHLWRQLDEPKTLDELCAAMLAEFDVDPQRCRSEVAALLEKLTAAGILQAD